MKKTKRYLPDVLIIPSVIVLDEKINHFDGLIYGVVYWFERMQNKQCILSNQSLAELLRTTPGNIQNGLTRLEQGGYIKRYFKDESRRKRTRIQPLVVYSKVSPISDTLSPITDTGVSPISEQKKISTIKEDNLTINTLRSVVDYFFELKGWDYKGAQKSIYGKFTKSGKELLELCDGNVAEAKICLDKLSTWAKSRDLDWSIETVFKKWMELDDLKPKEKKPYWDGCRIFQRSTGGRWYIMRGGEIKELGRDLKIDEIQWK